VPTFHCLIFNSGTVITGRFIILEGNMVGTSGHLILRFLIVHVRLKGKVDLCLLILARYHICYHPVPDTFTFSHQQLYKNSHRAATPGHVGPD
jgi:hypothetical protein